MHIGGNSLQGHQRNMESTWGVQSRPWPFRFTHLALCEHISIRIGHGQQENIHFLQDGGDGWVLLIISRDLSRDSVLVSYIMVG